MGKKEREYKGGGVNTFVDVANVVTTSGRCSNMANESEQAVLCIYKKN